MNVLSGGTENAIQPMNGFSYNKRLNAMQAGQFYEEGYRFCLRGFYTEPSKIQKSLNHEEVVTILNSGLAIMPVQNINKLDWKPTADLARIHGEQVAKDAKALGMPAGLNLWCNITGLTGDVSIQDVIIYGNHWYDAVMEQGYIPALFVNSCIPLSGNQLFCYLNFKHFCRNHEQAPHIPELGYELFRNPTISNSGTENRIVKYHLQLNQQGRSSTWLRKIK